MSKLTAKDKKSLVGLLNELGNMVGDQLMIESPPPGEKFPDGTTFRTYTMWNELIEWSRKLGYVTERIDCKIGLGKKAKVAKRLIATGSVGKDKTGGEA